MTNAIDPVIVAKDLRKKYGDITAVNGISFEVRPGEVFGMLGPNGAGKTTTVEILEGMRDADSGEAIINGINVKDDPTAVKAMIGVQLQQNAFFDNLKLSEIVDLYAKLYLAKVDPVEVLSRVGLDNRKNAKYAELSGGAKTATIGRSRPGKRSRRAVSRRANYWTRPASQTTTLGACTKDSSRWSNHRPNHPLHGKSRRAL
jgi:ABC-type branched-subunit amino acid transport system ATPase component